MRTFYSAIFFLIIPLVILRLFWRSRKFPAYRKRILERFAVFEALEHKRARVWIHTASVGEFIAFKPIIDELLAWDSHDVIVTTMTPSGSERVVEAYGDKVFHTYIPYDLAFLVEKFLTKTKPVLAIFVETELWPNTLHTCKKLGIVSMLANGRLSQKSARGYQKIRWLSKPMIQALSCSAIQHEADAERFKALGLNPATCLVSGSIKFDIGVNSHTQESARFLLEQIHSPNKRKVLIAASTHKGEEEILLSIFQKIKSHVPSSLLILVPRHPDRFKEVEQLCRNKDFAVTLRSTQEAPTEKTDILLGDTMGELLMLYGCADIAFVGGSLIPNGGHNYLEAAVWGIPIISGTSTFNFSDISRKLEESNALFIADDKELIAAEVLKLFANESLAKRKGAAAADVVINNRGAKAKLLALIKGILQPSA